MLRPRTPALTTGIREGLVRRRSASPGERHFAGLKSLPLFSLCLCAFVVSLFFTTALDPEHGVAIIRFHGEAELHLEFLDAPHEVENLFGFLRKTFQFAGQPHQRLIQCQELISVFFEKFPPGLEGKASFSRWQQGKEKLRLLPQTSQRS